MNYYPETEADISFGEIGRAFRDEVISYGADKFVKFMEDKFKANGTCITLTNPNKGSTQLMYHLVDNSRPYEEFSKTRERYDIDFRISIDRNKKNRMFSLSNLVKSAFNK